MTYPSSHETNVSPTVSVVPSQSHSTVPLLHSFGVVGLGSTVLSHKVVLVELDVSPKVKDRDVGLVFPGAGSKYARPRILKPVGSEQRFELMVGMAAESAEKTIIRPTLVYILLSEGQRLSTRKTEYFQLLLFV